MVFFFFQAEDGIRDIGVTGVQTCALPICPHFCIYSNKFSMVAEYDRIIVSSYIDSKLLQSANFCQFLNLWILHSLTDSLTT